MKHKMKYQTVKQVIERQVPVGYWLVEFIPIWGVDEDGDDTNRIEDLDPVVRKVTAKDFSLDGMSIETNATPCDSDHHDLRDRLFRTKREAREHIEFTLKRWNNPQPWEAFVKLN